MASTTTASDPQQQHSEITSTVSTLDAPLPPSIATASNDNSTKPQVAGIDIQKALDILADRAASSSSTDHHHHDHHDHNDCQGPATTEACHVHQTESLRAMGQRIDLTAVVAPSTTTTTTTTEEHDTPKMDELCQKEQDEERRQRRRQELETKLKSMSVKELLQTVLETQQQRVKVYQDYNGTLTQVLQSGNLTDYMTHCAHATAAFSVCSDTIIQIRTIVAQEHGRTDLHTLLTNLQQYEKEKLNLTAALHLEQIRHRNENLNFKSQHTGDPRIGQLLQQGVQSLQHKVAACVENINETIEEIRYALLDESDNDDDDNNDNNEE